MFPEPQNNFAFFSQAIVFHKFILLCTSELFFYIAGSVKAKTLLTPIFQTRWRLIGESGDHSIIHLLK
jgi:hypothetical protein